MIDPDRPPSWTPVAFLIPAQAVFTFAARESVWRFQRDHNVTSVALMWAMVAGATIVLAVCLGRIAAHRGHSPAWGLVGVFSLFGVAAMVCLPPRREQIRGFPIVAVEPHR